MRGRARRVAAIGITIAAVIGPATTDAAWRPDLAMQPDGTAHFSWMPGTGYTSESLLSRALAPGGTLNATQFVAEFDGDVRTNAIGVDAAGRETIVYQQDAGAVSAPFLRRRHPDGSLGPVHRLSAAGAGGAEPEVAVEPDGDAVAVWTALSGNATKRHVLARRISAGGTLGPILTISSRTWDADSARLAVAPSGAAVFVWRRRDPGEPTVMTRALAPAGTLSTLQPLSYSPVQSSDPQVGLDADGNAVFTWRRDFGENQRIQVRRRSAAGTLSETLTISPVAQNSGAPQMAVDPTGRAVFTWEHYDSTLIRARAQAADGTLGDPRTLSASGRVAADPEVAIDRNGNAVFAWWVYDDNRDGVVQARRRAANGALGLIQDLSRPGDDAKYPFVGMDADGTAVVAWRRDPNFDGLIEARRRSPTGVLGAIQEIGR